jgi:hypothetical protein
MLALNSLLAFVCALAVVRPATVRSTIIVAIMQACFFIVFLLRVVALGLKPSPIAVVSGAANPFGLRFVPECPYIY